MVEEMHLQAFNFAVDVVDWWATHQDKPALVWAAADGRVERYRFSDISRLSSNMAASLARNGVGAGDRVLIMLPRIPQWQVAMVACLRLGAVAVPCIEMLTAKDVDYRAVRSGARAVITTKANVEKFATLSDQISVKVAVDGAPGWQDFAALADTAAGDFASARVAAEDPALLYFTSGSTGQPKGVLHASRGIYHWRHSAVEWLDLKPDDLMWCTADTGWSKAGTSILFGPWNCGSCVFFYDGPFDAAERLRLLERHGVTVYCAAGTEILRLLDQPVCDYDLSRLRRTVSAGEALSDVAVEGWRKAVGHTVAEAYGQTESLMTLANHPDMERRPQSMGKPINDNDLAIINDTGRMLPTGAVGELAIRTPNPQLMLGYWEDPARTAACYIDGPEGRWFRTGDQAEMDADGYFYHRGRGDDVINSSGYRIGPSEVEDVLLAHPAIAEAAVVGAPDAARGEIVVAYVVLRPGHEVSVRQLQDFVKAQTAPYKYPRAVRFADSLPKTLTGKIQRNVLRNRESAARDDKD